MGCRCVENLVGLEQVAAPPSLETNRHTGENPDKTQKGGKRGSMGQNS